MGMGEKTNRGKDGGAEIMVPIIFSFLGGFAVGVIWLAVVAVVICDRNNIDDDFDN